MERPLHTAEEKYSSSRTRPGEYSGRWYERGSKANWTANSLALHTQAVLQGAFILAKAQGGPMVAAESIDHLRRYIELLFTTTKKEKAK